MAAQKLFQDFPATMGGGVTPMITANITQKAPEDDPNTLAGYKARLAAQRAEEEGAYQSKLGYQRGLQLQWEQDDLRRQAEQMRHLDRQRKEAFELIYRPQIESGIRMQTENQRLQAGLRNTQMMNLTTPHGPQLQDPASGATVIPGFGLMGGQWHTSGTGARVPGPDPNLVQGTLNNMYSQSAIAQQASNTNPYYRNPYI